MRTISRESWSFFTLIRQNLVVNPLDAIGYNKLYFNVDNTARDREIKSSKGETYGIYSQFFIRSAFDGSYHR